MNEQETTEVAENEELLEEEFEDLFLTEEERLALLYYDARLKNSVLSTRIKELEVKLADIEGRFKVFRMQHDAANHARELGEDSKKVRAEMTAKREEAEARLGVNFVDCALDPETGKLTILPDD